jgi:hypothetical protein
MNDAELISVLEQQAESLRRSIAELEQIMERQDALLARVRAERPQGEPALLEYKCFACCGPVTDADVTWSGPGPILCARCRK